MFVEDSVVEVMPPSHASLVFTEGLGAAFRQLSRPPAAQVAIFSRNMTLDRSWDTALVLDEDSEADDSIDAAPAADFVPGPVGTAIRRLPDPRPRADPANCLDAKAK